MAKASLREHARDLRKSVVVHVIAYLIGHFIVWAGILVAGYLMLLTPTLRAECRASQLVSTSAVALWLITAFLYVITLVLIRSGRNLPGLAIIGVYFCGAMTLLSFAGYVCVQNDGAISGKYLLLLLILANGLMWVWAGTLYYLLKMRAMLGRIGLVLTVTRTDRLPQGESLGHFYRSLVSGPVERDFTSTNRLLVLVSTGHQTIGGSGHIEEKEGWLARFLREKETNPPQAMIVLLLDPRSPHAERRAKALGEVVEKYLELAYWSIRVCADLRPRIPNIRCFLYDREPVWKLIISDKYVWQQSYPSAATPHDSPVNVYEKALDDNGNTIPDPFSKAFKEMLENSVEVRLDKIPPDAPLSLKLLNDCCKKPTDTDLSFTFIG